MGSSLCRCLRYDGKAQISVISDAASHSRLLHANDIFFSGAGRPIAASHPRWSNHDQDEPKVPSSADTHALFLDVDGTLLSIAPHPDAVHVPADLLELLNNLNGRLQGALALISGRSIADLDKLFAPLELSCAGVHGLERRGADAVIHGDATAHLLEPLRRPLAEFAGRREGLLVEDKQQSLALHYRNAPSCAAEAEAFLQKLIDTDSSSLELHRGKMVFEVRAGGAHKGTAIAAFMDEPPFAGRTPVFIGDDVTDEDGFETVNRLGGLSIRVGRDENTSAARSLADEAAVFAWLRSWIGDDQQGEVQ